MMHRGLFFSLASFVFLVAPGAMAVAQEPAAGTGVLDVSLPPGAAIVINGTDYGDRRHFEMRPLDGKWLYPYDVVARFRGGETVQRRLLLKGGWGLRMALAPPNTSRPEPVLQRGHAGAVFSVAFSPDGRYVLTGSQDKTAILWNTATGQQVRVFHGHDASVSSIAFSPDGRHVLTGSHDNTAILWDVATGQQVRVFRGHDFWVESVVFSPDGREVLTGSWDSTAILWDATTGQQVRVLRGHDRGVNSVAFSPDGRQVLTGSFEKTAILWNKATGEQVRVFQKHDASVSAVAFSADGLRVLIGSTDNTAILWDATTGQQIRVFRGHHAWVDSVAFSPDGRQVLTGSLDKTAILWDTATGDRVRDFHTNVASVSSVAFSPDGRRILTGSDDKTAIVWNTATDQQVRVLRGHRVWVSSVAFSLDGRRMLTASGDESAILWDTATGQQVRVFRGHRDPVLSVAFSPDGRHMLSGSRDKTAIVWDTATGQRVRVFRGHRDLVWSVAYGPDGRHVLTGSWDKTAILWDTENGQQIRSFGGGHTSWVHSLAFSPDGHQVLTGSGDGTTHLWDVATGDELACLISLDQGRDWLVVTPEGLFDGSASGRQKVMYRIGGGLNVVPVDRFFQDFYRPGLLAEIRRGERPMPAVSFNPSPPPLLKIVSPQAGSAEHHLVTIEVEAIDQGGGIRGPELFHMGSRFQTNGKPERHGKVVRRTYSVALIEGENRFEVKAASSDGSWESEPATLTLRYQMPLEKPEVYLLAVGISHYGQDSLDLKYPSDDARAIAELFRSRAKSLYRDVHVTELLDPRATKEGIRQALSEIAKRARAQDTLVVSLSGHGTMIGQRYYFLTHEFRSRPGHSPEEDVSDQGLAADVLADLMAPVPALKRILVFDTCQSGGAVGLGRRARDPFAFRGAIERLVRAQGVCTIAAAPAGAEAQEVDELRHGVLTYVLLAALGGVDFGPLKDQPLQPKDPEHVADVQEWFSYAGDRVPELMKRYYQREQEVDYRVGGRLPVLPVTPR